MARANENEWIFDNSLLNEGIKKLPEPPQKLAGIGFRAAVP